MQVPLGTIMFLLITPGLGLLENIDDSMNRIFKGVEASDGQFPYVVFIIIGYSHSSNKTRTCSGALIKFDTILTAAHCLHNDGSGRYYEYKPGNVIVAAGKADLNEYYLFRLKNPLSKKYNSTPEIQESIASRLHMHPKYKKNMLLDVGLIKIAKPFQKTKYVNTVGYRMDEFPGKKTCYLIGYGDTHLGTNRKLNFFTTQNVKTKLRECGADFDLSEVYCLKKNRPSEPCGCSGDSGAPMVCNSKVYGVYIQDFYFQEDREQDVCGDYVINLFVKLSVSEQNEWFVNYHAKQFGPAPTSCSLVSQLSSFCFLVYLIVFVKN